MYRNDAPAKKHRATPLAGSARCFLITDQFFQALDRGGNPAAPGDKAGRGPGVQRHHRAAAEQAAERELLPHAFPMAGMTRTAVVLELIMPMAAWSAIMAEITSAGGISRNIDHIEADRAHRRHGFQLSIRRQPQRAASIIPASSVTGMNAPERPPTWEEAITPPFFTASLSRARAAVVPWAPQHSSPISSRMWATESPTAGVGGQGQIHDPKGNAETGGGFPGDELAHPGNFEGGALDEIGHGGQVAVPRLGQSRPTTPGRIPPR